MSTFSLAVAGDAATGLLIFGVLGISGFRLALAMSAVTPLVANAVADTDIALAGGAQQMVAQLGTVVGIQVLQSVQAGREASIGLTRSFSKAFAVGAMVGLAGLFAAVFVRRSDGDDATIH